jgi:hypothetical protein
MFYDLEQREYVTTSVIDVRGGKVLPPPRTAESMEPQKQFAK